MPTRAAGLDLPRFDDDGRLEAKLRYLEELEGI